MNESSLFLERLDELIWKVRLYGGNPRFIHAGPRVFQVLMAGLKLFKEHDTSQNEGVLLLRPTYRGLPLVRCKNAPSDWVVIY